MAESTQAPDQLPWNPNCSKFPSRKELPQLPGAPEGAAWVWGEDDQVLIVYKTAAVYGSGMDLLTKLDQLGRLNLLTPQRVKASAQEILTGEMVRLE